MSTSRLALGSRLASRAWRQPEGQCPKLAPYQLGRLAASLACHRRAACTHAAPAHAREPAPAAGATDPAFPSFEERQLWVDEHFMRMALREAAMAADEGEVPVGAVLVSPGGHVLAAAHNRSEAAADPTAHAELLCLRAAAAAQRTGGWRLLDATLYVTLEPCPMCAGALLQSRVGTVVYGARNRLLGADGSWIAMLPQQQDGDCSSSSSCCGGSRNAEAASSSRSSSSSGGDSGSNADDAAQPTSAAPMRPHPFHPNLQVRRGVLAQECAQLMRAFFSRRRREQAEAAAKAKRDGQAVAVGE